ncbi:small integral membrane protein 24-like [Thalassophryne amazonica]|uniref:small integral membrane protein 24-like n=1 Tax=Thalassophryne amazonica TaxID=390379 RepID=UPI00147139CF|nr:small integral membrane protein 24-like [Thalassophryne amazonica]XP_034035221.1 small integral membrane protein 24-like [Thalassophryne amazonica]
MGKVSAVFSCLLLTFGGVTSQTADGRALPQWLTGIIAVVGFLFLTFIAFLVNKAWCAGSRTSEEAVMDMEDISHNAVRSKDSVYNTVIDSSVEKATAM